MATILSRLRRLLTGAKDPRASRKYECCRQESNMTLQASGREDVTIEVCDVCQRRHFIARVDPGRIGSLGSPTSLKPLLNRRQRLFQRLSRI